MRTWLHTADALRSLADESGPIGQWARLQRLGRGLDTELPEGADWAGPMLTLLPSSVDDWIATRLTPATLPTLDGVAGIGVAPTESGGWTAPIAALLDGENARHAANLLARYGALDRSHLARVLKSDRDDERLLGWVLASTPPAELDAVAAQVAPELRADVDEGCPRILEAVDLLTPGHPDAYELDPVESAILGARLARVEPDLPTVRGSVRSRTLALATALAADRSTPVAALTRALVTLEKTAPLHPALLAALSWEAHFTSSGDAFIDVTQHHCRDPHVIRKARLHVRETGELPDVIDTVPQRALLLEAADRSEIGLTVLDGDVESRAEAYLFAATALRCPEHIPRMLDLPDRRGPGLALAAFAPIEEVLSRLLQLSVPADPEERFDLARALVCMGDPAVLPRVRALLGHLEAGHVSNVKELALSFFNLDL